MEQIARQTFPFSLPPLPYSYDALEPAISAETLHFHHDKHLKKYIDNLNAALESHPEFHDWPLERLLMQNYALPYSIQQAVNRNAGGVYNHELYFARMRPAAPDGKPHVSAPLRAELEQQFGSFQAFQAAFQKSAVDVFGSGYAVLCRDRAGNLSIQTVPNQCTVLPQGLIPVNLCDVWEHAYYLDYQNLRDKYITAWFSVAVWA